MTSPIQFVGSGLRRCYLMAVGLLLAISPQLNAQVFQIDQNDNIDSCSGILTDDGGTNGPSTAGTYQVTICSNSANIDESHIRLVFDEIAISGTIQIYNGDAVDPNTQIGIDVDPTANGTNLTFEATAANPTGCLTVVYNSVGGVPGFEAGISCVRACQPVIANLLFSEPPVEPVDTGYIDVCVGQPITFNGRGIYPEDGVIYSQSDLTSTFQWQFDDGATATTPTATYAYDEPGGYTVQLFITDVNGCMNTNLISQRVRVSPTPTFNLQNDFPDVACADDTLTLTGSTQFDPNDNSAFIVTTPLNSFGASQVLADTTFLPDGNGVQYSSSLQFNNFQPGQILTSVEDIESICLNMEHSYAGDLDLWVTCPNGSRVDFIEFEGPGLGGQYFGVPVDIDADLSPGIGFDYCFIPGDDDLLSISQYAIQVGTGPGNTFPAGSYGAVTPWENLLGCPLNGEWTLNIQDNLFSDNGYIFSWSIAFADDLFSDLETFTVGFAEAGFLETDDLIFYSADSIVATPGAAGNQQYTYQIVDDFGCVFDTTLTVDVLPVSDPNCYDCQPLLDAEFQEISAALGATVQTALASQDALLQDVAFRIAPAVDFGASLYPNLGQSYESQIDVSSIFPGGITDVNTQLVEVCVTLETNQTTGVNLLLQAPDGTPLQLSDGADVSGSNFTQTCFTPGATTALDAGSAPYTGEFLPDGNFDFLNGAPILGDWTLRAWDASGSGDVGRFVSWSITFQNRNEITYTWGPDNGTLSCLDCPNPSITVDGETTTYSVTATDSYGCSETGTVSIVAQLDVDVSLSGTDVTCFGDTDGAVFADINGGLEPYDIQWNVEASGDTLLGVGAGTYIIFVTDANGSMDSDTIVINQPDELTATIEITDVLCNGDATGEIAVTIAGGTPPYTTEPADLTELTAGSYTIFITDDNGCEFTETVTVTEPEAITLDAAVVDVTCNGDDDGSIDLTVTGGSGDYTFAWSNGADTEDIDGLDGGDYGVTVTDGNGCIAELTVTIDEASSLEVVSLEVNNLLCFEDNTGSISLDVTGGTPPYTYLWSNGGENASIEELAAGTYSGTLTDAEGCTISTGQITITQPELLTCEVEVLQEPDQGDNGALIVNTEGGTGAYTYAWSNGETTQEINGLEAGDYVVTVTDENGCTTICEATLQAFATVGDFVFFDEDRDGIQDPGEAGIPGVTVVITATDDSFTETTTTDANGNYSFLVAPGEYTIAFFNPGGLAPSPIDQGEDDELDSDIIHATFTTAPFTLALDEENFSIDAGLFDPCDPDLTSAGTIGANQVLCGPGNVPDELFEITPAAGGSGDYNYIWMMTTGDPNAPIQAWTPIPNTNSINYQPGVLYETTFFTRCVRQEECPYIESNVIEIVIGDDATADFTGPNLVCQGETVTYTPVGLDGSNSINWSVGGGASLVVNADNSATITWGSFGGFQVVMTNTENGCVATTFQGVTVSSNTDNCFNDFGTPGVGTSLSRANVAEVSGPLASVFPNPARVGTANLRLHRPAAFAGQTVEVQYFEATGRLLATELLDAGPQQSPLRALNGRPAGLYLIRVTQAGETETHRVILR